MVFSDELLDNFWKVPYTYSLIAYLKDVTSPVDVFF